MVEEDEKDFKISNICEINIGAVKVIDHCHWTGNYRGPAHNTCNTNVEQKHSNFIPFIFHNFSNYD